MNGSKQSVAPLVKVGARHQVTIPKEIVSQIQLAPGEYVAVTLERGRIIVAPKHIVDRDDAWFWSKEWQAKEREADEAIAKGEVFGPYKNAREVIKALKQKRK